MPVSNFINRASNLVSRVLENQGNQKHSKSVDDIIFYKRNVCIHLPSNIGNCSDHNLGYLIIRRRIDKVLGKTLILSWTSCDAMEKKCRLFFSEFGVSELKEETSEFLEKQAKPSDHLLKGEVSRSSSGIPGCESFTFDLGRIRSLKVVSDSSEGTTGQLIILSSEGHYKIIHFHDSGLDDLLQVLDRWNFLQKLDSFWRKKRRRGQELEPCKATYLEHFLSVCASPEKKSLHPEEGRYNPINRGVWRKFVDVDGRIVNKRGVKKLVFFGGISANMRSVVWPFLLDCYDFELTSEAREEVRRIKRQAYEKIKSTRESLTEEEYALLLEHHSVVIDRDVVRTDRYHPYYMGAGNPNLNTLRTILENYALTHQRVGYFQGMSDFLAPLLAELRDEAEAYWCFEEAMKRTLFYEMANCIDIDRQLAELRELIRLLLPSFYERAFATEDGRRMTYCHRWLLILFKRDFQDPDFLRIWESCWSRHETQHFHLFVCVAVLDVYGDDVVTQRLDDDDTIMLFNSLSMNMNVDVILRKARSLLHQFKHLDSVPCSVRRLVEFSKAEVECVGHPDGSECPSQQFVDSWEML